MSIKTDLQIAHSYLANAIDRLETNERSLNEPGIAELIRACETIDLHYRQFCKECDDDFGEDEGTTYRDGISLEYEIEADWWHDVSLALRKLRKDSNDLS